MCSNQRFNVYCDLNKHDATIIALKERKKKKYTHFTRHLLRLTASRIYKSIKSRESKKITPNETADTTQQQIIRIRKCLILNVFS